MSVACGMAELGCDHLQLLRTFHTAQGPGSPQRIKQQNKSTGFGVR